MQRLTIRMSEDLYQRVRARADAEGRSVSAYVRNVLERAFPPGPDEGPAGGSDAGEAEEKR